MFNRMAVLLAAAAVFLTAAAQSVVPSNATLQNQPYVLIAGSKMQDEVANLHPITNAANSLNHLTGALYLTTTENASNITMSNIAFVSCDRSAYPGNLQAIDVINTVISKNVSATLLYSLSAETCSIMDTSALNSAIILSLTENGDAQPIVNSLQSSSSSLMYLVNIAHAGTIGQSNSSNGTDTSSGSNTNPLGPSPSTAVAMIILYSITGVITALFLIIIITGAIRAHRNPDRYGPRDVVGRPRQSRAKGLARAMLESIPIVKFGEQEPPKPTDVEMASQHSTGETGETRADASSTPAADNASTREPTTDAAETLPRHSLAEGIAPAENVLASQKDTAEKTQALGCSICTEDFEAGQDVRVLPCDHKFHPACIDPWLLNVSGTCPLCRVDLRPSPSHESAEGSGEGDQGNASLAPPLEDPASSVDQQAAATPEAGRDATRRRSRLRSILRSDRLDTASTEERLAAIRRLRNREEAGSTPEATNSTDAVNNAGTAGDDARRRRRLTARLQEAFGVRTRQQGSNSESTPGNPPQR